jgi:hypothetical protein
MQKICARCQFRVSGNRLCQVCGFSKFIECEITMSEQSFDNFRTNTIEFLKRVGQWCLESIKTLVWFSRRLFANLLERYTSKNASGEFAYSYESVAERNSLVPARILLTEVPRLASSKPATAAITTAQPRPAVSRRKGELEVDYTRRQLEELKKWFRDYGKDGSLLQPEASESADTTYSEVA